MSGQKKWIVVAAALFGFGMAFGFSLPGEAGGVVAPELHSLQELAAFLFSLPPVLTALFIFLKNAVALLMSFALSPFLLLMPIITLVINGVFLSYVSLAVVQEKSFGYLMAGILPHGIIEIPAFILGEAAALSFGAALMLALFRRKPGLLISVKRNLVYLAIAMGLLLPAAFIETFITPLVIGLLG